MGKEIELKYRLTTFPADGIKRGDIEVLSRKTIYQTYLAYDGHQELRIRKLVQGDREEYTHTFKSGQGRSRDEVEYTISPELYEQLQERLNRVPLIKIRTTLAVGNTVIEIDEYQQYDLQTVEVEFTSEKEAAAFTPPAWFGEEIGDEEEFRNKQLWLNLQK